MPTGRRASDTAGAVQVIADGVLSPANDLVWSSIVRLHGASKLTGVPMVEAELRRSGDLERAGGAVRLSQLASAACGSGEAEAYAGLVHGYAGLRRYEATLSRGLQPARQTAPADVPDAIRAVRERTTGPPVTARTGPGEPISGINPLLLEIHPAIESSAPGTPLPCIRRPHDNELAELVELGAEAGAVFPVMVGGSSTGKTRSCWEAAQPLAARGWHLWSPLYPTPVEAAVTGLGRVEPRTVVWLNDLHRYVAAPHALGERLALALQALLRDPSTTSGLAATVFAKSALPASPRRAMTPSGRQQARRAASVDVRRPTSVACVAVRVPRSPSPTAPPPLAPPPRRAARRHGPGADAHGLDPLSPARSAVSGRKSRSRGPAGRDTKGTSFGLVSTGR